MNGNYYYKPYKNYTPCTAACSKKGTHAAAAPSFTEGANFAEKALAFIDTVLEFFCSAEFISVSKLIFGLVMLCGFFGLVGGVGFASVLLVSGCVCLTLVIFLEYVVVCDKENS